MKGGWTMQIYRSDASCHKTCVSDEIIPTGYSIPETREKNQEEIAEKPHALDKSGCLV
jgi:hypothetical protein